MFTKDIPGFSNYFVTTDGCVYSKNYKGYGLVQQLKFGVTHVGYSFVSLFNDNRKKKTISIHRLVAQAFVPNPNNYSEVNHRNANKMDNHYLNLEWCTHLQNMQHAERNGLIKHPKGEKVVTSILKKEDVIRIRDIYKTGGFTQREVGLLFGVEQRVISHIVRKSTWKHI